ncbi:MAG: hypothetical protein ACJ73S_00625 [Mycobacteriales bacterium]|jgi:hypothetical protein
MSYQIQFFLYWPGDELPALAETVTRGIASQAVGMEVRERMIGPGWTAFEVRLNQAIPTTMVIHLQDNATKVQVERASSELNAPDLHSINAVVELSLSGETDEELLTAVWSTLVGQLSALPYDEESGFEASLSS